MAIKADKLGPGHLTFGETGSPTEFGSQVTKCELAPEVEDGDTVGVLSGEEITDGETETYKLTGEFYQDYSGMTSLIVWCKTNSGIAVPFTFIPVDDSALAARGTVRVRPVKFGGEVKKRNTTEFEFIGVGDYEYFDHTAP